MKKIFITLIFFVLLTACEEKNVNLPDNVLRISLAGDLAERELEASGLAWYKNYLVILPQYPHKWDDNFDGAVFFIPKKRIENFVNGKNRNPIFGEKISFVAEGLDEIGKSKGSGYEAITFVGDTVFVSIESLVGDEASDFIVRGLIDFPNKKIILDANSKREVKSQTGIFNMGEETILTYRNNVFTIHEANGANVNPNPMITKLSFNLKEEERIKFQNIDYRITDATAVDSLGKFYVTNYYYPGEYKKLKPNLSDEEKPFAVEQILQLHIIEDKVVRTLQPPLVISKGEDKKGRNWEGIVKFNNGFLLITDMFPQTILGFVKKN